jgi:hypothetical protein
MGAEKYRLDASVRAPTCGNATALVNDLRFLVRR